MPLNAPTDVPTMIAVGVARPRAGGERERERGVVSEGARDRERERGVVGVRMDERGI